MGRATTSFSSSTSGPLEKRLDIAQTHTEVRLEASAQSYAGNFFTIPIETTGLDEPSRLAYREAIIACAIQKTSLLSADMKCLVLEVRHSYMKELIEKRHSADVGGVGDRCLACRNASVVPLKVLEWCENLSDGKGGIKMTVATLEALQDISEPKTEDDEFGADEGWTAPEFDGGKGEW
ncbi:hypothetical protein LTR56_026807 [Elasticomyces elasticus]|nr:hypothetical protein LTR56_026807 [Elasticomyces elasticus]KAK3617212.1 hypothetical protein LTR22_026804 [Elasticomyces elasticus]KAK4914166.1 hypothetical protein LTR49_017598 [Elasticomyces elasticus]